MKIRMLPKSKAADAAEISFKRNLIFEHNGKAYFVKSLSKIGTGPDSRLVAELEPAFNPIH
ncbi:hypothetical protein [Vibrio sp. S234-5]|uniref:hypothetical protein n=1 Tax=Vibrio sp. S234-5 TaxID=1616781 RepID=UPI0005EF9359|nr:hypothetical protein [Vibrio sp. S234-5]KJR21550.1 hypothetical protein UF06_19460 [Vibrio sp. S234-5]